MFLEDSDEFILAPSNGQQQQQQPTSRSKAAIEMNSPVTVANALLGARVRPDLRHFHDSHSPDEYGGGDGEGVLLAVVQGQTPASIGKRYAKVKWHATGKTALYRIGCDDSGATDLVFAEAIVRPELEGAPVDAATAVIGARVSRAPNAAWDWGNEQKEQLTAPGGAVIVGSNSESGWVRVKFAGNGKVQVYRGGADGKWDLCYGCVGQASPPVAVAANSQQTSSSSSSSPVSTALPQINGGEVVCPQNFRRGARVVANRGGDWRWGDQDRENGDWGVLMSIDKEQWVRVKWASGLRRSYRAGADAAFDVMYDENPLQPKLPGAPAAAAAAAASSSLSPVQRAKYKFCSEFKNLEPVVVESVLYQVKDETKAREILSDMNACAAAAAAAAVPNIDDILLAPEPPREEEKKDGDEEVIIKVKKREVTDEDSCLICMCNPRCYVAAPCGHLLVCPSCVGVFRENSNGQCCVCRAPFTMLLKIYM